MLLRPIARAVRIFSAVFLVAFLAPIAAHSVVHWQRGGAESWTTANWSSTGLLPRAADHKPAMVRIYAARTGRWRGNFAVHTWIVVKPEDGAYARYDKVGWGQPIRRNAYAPDGLWFSNEFETVFAADGPDAARLIPQIEAAVRAYPYANPGDYSAWPGPNSNTFVSCVLQRVPEIGVALPPIAVGKDFPCASGWYGLTPSRTGVRLSFGGYAGVSLGWVEGFELNILGAIAGIDVRRPALKLPGFGRIGMAAA